MAREFPISEYVNAVRIAKEQRVKNPSIGKTIASGLASGGLGYVQNALTAEAEKRKSLSNFIDKYIDDKYFYQDVNGEKQPLNADSTFQVVSLLKSGKPLPENIKLDYKVNAYKQSGTELDGLRRERETRLQRQNDIGYIKTYGGMVSEQGLKDMGLDLTQYIDAGGGKWKNSINPENGQMVRVAQVIPYEDFKRKVSQKTLDKSERDWFDNITTETTQWRQILNTAKSIGISPDNMKNLKVSQWDVINSPVGKFSIPARFSIVAQYNQDPRYTALQRELETVFASFRKRITGAQAAAAEIEYLREILPALSDNPEVFLSSVDGIVKNTEELAKEKLDLYDTYGRDTTSLRPYIDKLFGQSQQQTPQAQQTMQQNTQQQYNFNTVEEANAANLPKGTIIYIQGRKAVVE